MTEQQIKSEVNYLQGVLGTRFFGYRTTCESKVAKALLLSGFFLYNGRGHKPRAKSLGCGVYEVWAESLNG